MLGLPTLDNAMEMDLVWPQSALDIHSLFVQREERLVDGFSYSLIIGRSLVMAEPRMPGRSYASMAHLVNLNFQIWMPTPFDTESILAIFWEETFFNNVTQIGSGTAVGFGQTEPKEFWRFDAKGSSSQLARKKGYLVHGLPRRHGKRLLGSLNDLTSVKVACAMIRDLFERGKRTKRSIMNAYGGVGFKGKQPAHLAKKGGREALIQGILGAGEALKKAKTQDEIIKALKIARDFNLEKEFRRVLFPSEGGI